MMIRNINMIMGRRKGDDDDNLDDEDWTAAKMMVVQTIGYAMYYETLIVIMA